LKPSREVTFEHFYQSLQAAVAGAGLAIGPAALVADDLRSGALVAPWGFVRDGSSYVLMRSLEKSEDKLFGKVLAWLRREAVEIEKIIAEAGAKASKAVKD
jgi:DNA-binding transcriptional LysR family regulator